MERPGTIKKHLYVDDDDIEATFCGDQTLVKLLKFVLGASVLYATHNIGQNCGTLQYHTFLTAHTVLCLKSRGLFWWKWLSGQSVAALNFKS